MSIENIKKFSYTEKQGQYLAFIYYYTKINGFAPAQADFQRYFAVTPSTVHQMILQLEKNGLIKRVPGRARSIELLISKNQIPDIE